MNAVVKPSATSYEEQSFLVRRAVERAVRQPEWFYENVLRAPCFPWHIEAVNAILDVRRSIARQPTVVNHKALQRLSAVSGHGTGKTHMLGLVSHLWNFTTYGLAVITAPKQEQVRTRFFGRYKRMTVGAVDWYRDMISTSAMSSHINGDDTWGIQGETASEPENLAGYHDKPQLFLVDEASSKRLDAMYPVIEGALSTPGSVLVEISNPTRISGEFASHHLIKHIREMYYRMHITPDMAPGLVDEKWVDFMAKKYGKDSPIFKVRVLGEFVDMGERQLIALEWLYDAQEAGEDFEPDGSIPVLIISADVADGGVDTSSITAARKYSSGYHMLRREKYSFPAAEAPIRVADMCCAMFERFGGIKNKDVMIVDGIGVGAGTCGTLMDRGYSVIRHVGGATSDKPLDYRNRRVQSYFSMRDELRDSRVYYASNFVDDEREWLDYCAEMVSIQTKPGTERVEDLETKEEYKAREKKSPDDADSSAMIFITSVPIIGRAATVNQSIRAVRSMTANQEG